MKIDKWLCLHSKRYKLHRISKAIGIKPYKWQRDFALGKMNNLAKYGGRCTGKTMAVMLRLLLLRPDDRAFWIFGFDPDYSKRFSIFRWYQFEYCRLSEICEQAGIPVVIIPKDYGYHAPIKIIDEVQKWGADYEE